MEKKIGTIKFEYTEMPFSIIGINTSLSDFQLAYRLQQIIKLDFEKTENFFVYKEKQKQGFPFSCLLHVDNDSGLAYMIMPTVSVEDDSVLFLNGLQKIDYVLMILGRDYSDVLEDVCKSVKAVKNVVYATVLYPLVSSSKSKILKQTEIISLSGDIEYFKDNNVALEDIYI